MDGVSSTVDAGRIVVEGENLKGKGKKRGVGHILGWGACVGNSSPPVGVFVVTIVMYALRTSNTMTTKLPSEVGLAQETEHGNCNGHYTEYNSNCSTLGEQWSLYRI